MDYRIGISLLGRQVRHLHQLNKVGFRSGPREARVICIPYIRLIPDNPVIDSPLIACYDLPNEIRPQVIRITSREIKTTRKAGLITRPSGYANKQANNLATR